MQKTVYAKLNFWGISSSLNCLIFRSFAYAQDDRRVHLTLFKINKKNIRLKTYLRQMFLFFKNYLIISYIYFTGSGFSAPIVYALNTIVSTSLQSFIFVWSIHIVSFKYTLSPTFLTIVIPAE